jgi:hypothetical protein
MTRLDGVGFLRAAGRLSIALPWPGTTLAVAVVFLGLALGMIPSVRDACMLTPEAVANGGWRRLLSGQAVQPPDWILAFAAAAALAVFAREIEERRGPWIVWRLLIVAGAATGLGWVGVQAFAERLGLQASWSVPMVSYPAVTSLVTYRTVLSPWARLGPTGYRAPSWAAAFGYLGVTLGRLLWHSWSVLVPAHLCGVVLGAAWAYVDQASLRRAISRVCKSVASDAYGATPAGDGRRPERGDDEEWDRKLDRLLAKIAARGEDSLSRSERGFLVEAAERIRLRRRP